MLMGFYTFNKRILSSATARIADCSAAKQHVSRIGFALSLICPDSAACVPQCAAAVRAIFQHPNSMLSAVTVSTTSPAGAIRIFICTSYNENMAIIHQTKLPNMF